ncbi:glycosyltransferase family 4 protein [Catellatospora paridis]|uniref:glycosyltransferase family 4 protein n=1 Tax=Catellatospora paridis TaxID=1617086 RepID=UPI0012D4136F|nr:glycosyltransferase family 1 protein [Catellatospora paridis]
MRVGLDIRALQTYHRYRGIGVVLTEFLKAIELAPDDHLVLFRYDHEAPEAEFALPEGVSWEVVSLGQPPTQPLVRAVLGTLRPGGRLDVSEHRLNVFVQPDSANGLPTGAPVVTIAYDLIPLIFAAHYQPRMSLGALRRLGVKGLIGGHLRAYLYRWQLRQLARADRVIAISDATRRDLLLHLPALPPDRVSVIPLAANAAYAPTDERTAHAKYGVTKPYLLYTGGVDFRKNVVGLVDAFHELRATKDCQLVLVGKDFVTFDANAQRSLRRLLDTSPYAADIIRPGFIATDELVELYNGAVAFVFPSLYEGFGLPVLEAMASGCPVVTYRNSSLPEVAGEAALLLDEQDDLASALHEVFSDETRRAQMRSAGLKQAARFSWPGTVGQMMAAVRSTARHAN